MIGNLLRNFERAAILEVRRDAGGAESVVADFRFDARNGDYAVESYGRHLAARVVCRSARHFSCRRLKERLIQIAGEACADYVGVEQVFQFVVARHFMLFSAFFM